MHPVDHLVIALYGALVLLVGARVARGHQSTAELWLGGRRLPTWAVLLSMVSTELSAATFIGVPEAAYHGDWSYLQFAFGALAGKLLLSLTLIPLYHTLGVVTVYGLLDRAFGPRSRRAAALCFIAGRIVASGVRLFIASLAFAAVTGVAVEQAILVCGLVAGAYTLAGGIRSVIYTDVLQGAVFLSAAVAATAALAAQAEGGAAAIYGWAEAGDRLRVFTFDPALALASTRPFLVGLIGGFFLTLATHGTDHDMVQRLLTTRDGRSGGRALLGSALLNFPLTALFLWIGTSIAFVYQTPPDYSIATTGQIFPLYALHELPMGLRGLIFAGILAAAMSSFDSAICAVATTWTVDLLPTQENAALALRRSRRVSMLCCGLLLASALAIAAYHESMTAASTVSEAPRFRLVDLALSAMTVLYGGLLGIFGLAVTARRRGSDTSVPIGLAVGAAVGLGLFLHPLLWGETLIAWPWWIPISASISFATAALGHRGVPSKLSDVNA